MTTRKKTKLTAAPKPASKRDEAIEIFARVDRALPSDASAEVRVIAYNAEYPWASQCKTPPVMWYNLIDEHLEDLRKIRHWNGQ